MTNSTYDNGYAYDNVYGHTVELLRRHRPAHGQAGVHIDLGCGYGRIGEVIENELSRHYLGLDVDVDAIAALRSRGLDAREIDFDAPAETLRHAIDHELGGRRILSVSMIDVLEHLRNPASVLRVVHDLIREHGAMLVVSVPNLAHRDVGFKLAFGRYDITHAGLLDHTHLNPFTAFALNDLLVQNGLHTIDRNDVQMVESDQHFPALHPALGQEAVLGSYLRALRDQVDGHATTNQLVVACLAGPVQAARFQQLEQQRVQDAPPFLSVVTRTQGRRISALVDLLLSLSAQECMDFEVVLVGHRLDVKRQIAVEEALEQLHPDMRRRVNFIRVDHGNRTTPLNGGFGAASGQYITILDDDDLPMAHWVQVFRDLANTAPGRLLRSVAVRQEFDWVGDERRGLAARSLSGFKHDYPGHFDLLEHLRDNFTPGMAIAIPRATFADLGFRFDETLTTAEDWDFIMRCALVCGVQSSPQVTCIYRWWVHAESSRDMHRPEEWHSNRQRIMAKMDSAPLLLPVNGARAVRDLLDERDALRHTVAQLRAQLEGRPSLPVAIPASFVPTAAHHALMLAIGSRSWRASAPMRRLFSLLRGRPLPGFNVADMTPAQAQSILDEVHRSRSWRLTRPLRAMKSLFGG